MSFEPVHTVYMPRKPAKRPTFSIHYVKAFRRDAGLSQEALADRLGVSHATVSRVERRIQELTQPMLDGMSAVFKESRGRILDGPPPPAPPRKKK